MILIKISIRRLVKLNTQLSISSRRWNNYVKSFIYATYRNFYFINIFKTMFTLRLVSYFLMDISKKRGNLLFVDKRIDLYVLLRYLYLELGHNFIGKNWVSGIFTNFTEFKLNYSRGRINFSLKNSGFYMLSRLPDALITFSFYENFNAVTEARILGIPVVSLVGSDLNPSGISFMLFGNDNTRVSLFLFAQLFKFSIIKGVFSEKLIFYKNIRKFCYLFFIKSLIM